MKNFTLEKKDKSQIPQNHVRPSPLIFGGPQFGQTYDGTGELSYQWNRPGPERDTERGLERIGLRTRLIIRTKRVGPLVPIIIKGTPMTF